MSEKVWPIDQLGNEIRQGDLLYLRLDEPGAHFYVMEVQPASIIHDAGGPIPVSGEMTLVLKIKLPFTHDTKQLRRGLVLKTPEGSCVGLQ
jgi:hypothetical protein